MFRHYSIVIWFECLLLSTLANVEYLWLLPMLLVRTYNDESLVVLCMVSNEIISWPSNVCTQNHAYLSNVEDCKVSISVESPSSWWIDLMLLLDSLEEISLFSFWFVCDSLWVGNIIPSWFRESCLWFVLFRWIDDERLNKLFRLWCWMIASFTALSVAFLPRLLWKMKNTYQWTVLIFSF